MKWEYVIIQQNTATINPGTYQAYQGARTKLGDSSDATLVGVLGKLGEMGWELVSSHARTDNIVEYILKRPKA